MSDKNRAAPPLSAHWRLLAIARAMKIIRSVEEQSVAVPAQIAANDMEIVSVADSDESESVEILPARAEPKEKANEIPDDEEYQSEEIRRKRAAHTLAQLDRPTKQVRRYVSAPEDEKDEESLGDDTESQKSDDDAASNNMYRESIADDFVVEDGVLDGDEAYGEEEKDEEEEAEATDDSEESAVVEKPKRNRAKPTKRKPTTEKSWHSHRLFGVSKDDFVEFLGRVPVDKEECEIVAEQIKDKRREKEAAAVAAAAAPKRRAGRLTANPVQMLHRFFEGDDEPFLKFLQYHYFYCAALANFGNWGSENFDLQMERFGDMALAGGLELTKYVAPPRGEKHTCFLCGALKPCGQRLVDAVQNKVIETIGGDCGPKFDVLLHAGYVYRCADGYREKWVPKEPGEVDWEIDELLKMLKRLERHKSDVLSLALCECCEVRKKYCKFILK